MADEAKPAPTSSAGSKISAIGDKAWKFTKFTAKWGSIAVGAGIVAGVAFGGSAVIAGTPAGQFGLTKVFGAAAEGWQELAVGGADLITWGASKIGGASAAPALVV